MDIPRPRRRGGMTGTTRMLIFLVFVGVVIAISLGLKAFVNAKSEPRQQIKEIYPGFTFEEVRVSGYRAHIITDKAGNKWLYWAGNPAIPLKQ